MQIEKKCCNLIIRTNNSITPSSGGEQGNMIISKHTQLGIRFEDESEKIRFCKLSISILENQKSVLNEQLEFLGGIIKNEDGSIILQEEDIKRLRFEFEHDEKYQLVIPEADAKNSALKKKIGGLVQKASNTIFDDLQCIINQNRSSKYFLICDSVYRAAELIQIGVGFTSRTLKDIDLGHYTYLMGKHRMLRFVVVVGAIKGFYYDDEKNIIVEFGLDIETGEYYATKGQDKIFSMIMQVMTFVELGDIEVIELLTGRNNGLPKTKGKITNTHNNTVFVVDSSWNKLIIRTEGFAVRGHFRLQPCGVNHADRKLTWIDAFEKHGYTRKPKAEIIR